MRDGKCSKKFPKTLPNLLQQEMIVIQFTDVIIIIVMFRFVVLSKTTDGLFHTTQLYFLNITLILMLRFALQLVQSNICTNTYTKAMIEL